MVNVKLATKKRATKPNPLRQQVPPASNAHRLPKGTGATIGLYPWFKFIQSLIFWQATWFLYFENQLSPAEAIIMYMIFDLSATALEVPSGYASDWLGRRRTLLAAAICTVIATVLLVLGNGFAVFAMANVFLGAGVAFASGTDSALLYESLVAEDQAEDVAQQELKSWRFGFSALAFRPCPAGLWR